MKGSSSGSEGPGPVGAKPCQDKGYDKGGPTTRAMTKGGPAKGYDKGGPMARGRAALPEPAPRRRRDDDNDESWIQVQLQIGHTTTAGGKGSGERPAPVGKGDCQTKEELQHFFKIERLERSASSSSPRDHSDNESWEIFPILESNLESNRESKRSSGSDEASSSSQSKRSSSLEEIPLDFAGGSGGWEGVVEKMIIRRAQNNLQLASQGGGVDEASQPPIGVGAPGSDHSAPPEPAPKLKLNVKIEVNSES